MKITIIMTEMGLEPPFGRLFQSTGIINTLKFDFEFRNACGKKVDVDSKSIFTTATFFDLFWKPFVQEAPLNFKNGNCTLTVSDEIGQKIIQAIQERPPPDFAQRKRAQ